jgi:hypothetical protein
MMRNNHRYTDHIKTDMSHLVNDIYQQLSIVHTVPIGVVRSHESIALQLKFKWSAYLFCGDGRARTRCPHTNAKALQNATTALSNFATSSPGGYHQRPSDKPRHRHHTAKMSLVSGEKSNFQFILRLLNTNVREPLLDRTPRGEYGMRWMNGYGDGRDVEKAE